MRVLCQIPSGLTAGCPHSGPSIHIAGGFAFAPLTDTSGELLRRLIDDNLVSCFLCCREAVTAMRRGKAGGRIVNVAALQALEPRNGANLSAATAAKAGVAALSAALGEELAREGILVNAPPSWVPPPIAAPCPRPILMPGRRWRR
jgi:NAD(P)-dependent dehydrogenase (short-subunit alcohol dehydrogenase family)